jgi:cell division protein FtsL
MVEQNYGNHVKWVPLFHFFVLPAMILNFGWSIYRLIRHWFSWNDLVGVLTALALLVGFLSLRIMALCVQDRVIRLEERIRFQKLLPDELKPRIGEFTVGQLVALRFASDAELPELARKVLTDKIDNRKTIKLMIKNWRADYVRA